MESQKIRIWRELLAMCDKNQQKNRTFSQSDDISFLVQKLNISFRKETHCKRTDINTHLLFCRVAKLIFSSSIIAFLHALVGPKRFRSYVIIFFEGSYIFGVNFSHGLGMLLRENGNKRI